MKYILLNLKRFEIPLALGGINRGPLAGWAANLLRDTAAIGSHKDAEFAAFLPEAHLPQAVAAAQQYGSPMHIGCQSVFRADVAAGGNFGAFTSNRTALSMKAIGVDYTLIGHSEERRDKLEMLREGGAADFGAVNRLLNQQIHCALAAGLKVVYCIGENAEEQPRRFDVLREQLQVGLAGVAGAPVIVAYEPIWAIGPGKTPPDAAYVSEIVQFVKQTAPGLPVVYGGGLKKENAKMLAGIAGLDGGLIALTRFSGDFGFYPEEYLEIVSLFLG